jgi:hypothetical protein
MALDDYQRILDKLDAAPTLVRRPLSPAEIESIERDVGLKAPDGVRVWFSKVGLFQDVSGVNACGFELHEQPKHLVEARKYILDLLGDRGANLFPFGHDGAGDEIAVRGDPNEQDMLVFVDHETRQATDRGLFIKWLGDVVDEAISHAGEEADEKFWCVQFSFQTADEQPILDAMRAIAPVTVPDNVWDKKPATATGVHPAKLGFVFMNQARLLSRSTFKAWSSPSFALDYEEPVSTPPEQSMIRRLDEVFKARPELNYKLVDYGPLNWPPSEEYHESSEPPAKKPWWKFW